MKTALKDNAEKGETYRVVTDLTLEELGAEGVRERTYITGFTFYDITVRANIY